MITAFDNLIFFGLLLSVLAGAFTSVLVYRNLRRRHEARWRELGEPGIFLNLPTEARRRVSRFIWKGEYRALGDSRLSRLIGAVKILTVVSLGLFVVGVAKALIGGFLHP